MKTKLQSMFIFTALAMPFFATYAAADATVTKTVTQQTQMPVGGKAINLNDFDINQDGILSTAEVGEMLFRLFDTNNDNRIDAQEYEARSIMTVVPMKKETTINYDFNNDGMADKTQYTSETFMENTQLSRFGANPAGLSPHEFIGKDFAAVDTDGNGGIDRAEWKNAYIFKISPMPVK